MYPLLEGVRILEVGKSDSARYCGKILAELGAEVSMLSSIGTARAEQRDNQSQPGRTREVFDRYLNQNKAVRTGSGRLADEEEIKRWSEEAELCILGYEAADMAHLPSALLAGGTSVLAITPFGLTGPNAHAPGGDLIASHAGGYAYHLAFPSSSPEDNPPKRGPAGQSLLFAGLIGAVAAIGALLGTGRGQPSTFMDLSEQEAVASLLFEELAAYNEGHLPLRGRWRTRRKVRRLPELGRHYAMRRRICHVFPPRTAPMGSGCGMAGSPRLGCEARICKPVVKDAALVSITGLFERTDPSHDEAASSRGAAEK